MTFAEMEVELNRIHGLPFPPADYQTHWEGLQDMPREALSGAVRLAAKSCDRFPAPSELRMLADAAKRAPVVVENPTTLLDQPRVIDVPFLSKPVTITREWHYYCEDCNDTGQWSVWCDRHEGSEASRKPWMVAQRCNIKSCVEHTLYPHEWVKQCACWYTNPALQRKREAQAKYADQRTKGKS